MFAPLLNTQEQQLTLLLSLLEQEKVALEQDDTIALYAVAEQKEQALVLIASADEEIAASSEKEQLNSDPQFAHQVETIKGLLAQCQERNELNGEIIKASNEKVRQLSAVIDQLQNQNASTYDKLGKKHSSQRMGKGFKA
ncbi:flagellar export chaperone FlgN [Agarivorans aestuarii]|uniref:Flagellar export chaperone FlgN n=1 Tax=Agarivorans aestuarii TaxID=1563703 RepID=A0ABU7G0E0_9ALTE|nr:flagellar export chaperone FlgN [Agarivorans aestuarii]MEE1672868.1 flagellar export chaperone FlgN [Agarivorans aestuarii]